MQLESRRAHWTVGHASADLLERQRQTDYACFTLAEHAAWWLADQLAERTVAELGGFGEAAEWYDWVRRQAGHDEEADAEQRYASNQGVVAVAEIGHIEYRMMLCTCTGDVTGRCGNLGCDRDTDWDSEPDGGRSPGYTKWFSQCFRCSYPVRANGGYVGRDDRKPVPYHQHEGEGEGRVAKLIESDQWVGWRCCEGTASEVGCGQVWRFASADQWASQYRLTRAWDGKVTGTEGYARTKAEADAEADRRNERSQRHGLGFTVGVEPVGEDAYR